MKILISHSWEDKSYATNIYESLKPDGHEVWFDIHQLLPGDVFQDVIDAYIKKCDVMVLVWTKYAQQSNGVAVEINTARQMQKRIIPVMADGTSLGHHDQLSGILGIPGEPFDTTMMLLRRAVILLSATEADKQSLWFKEIFGHITDLGGYLNYVNTYRSERERNNDGRKDEWVERLEGEIAKNEKLTTEVLPEMNKTLAEMQAIMQQLEHGNVPLEQLISWKDWCNKNNSYHPETIGKLKSFIESDIQRLQQGGTPVHVVNYDVVEDAIERLDKAISQKKEEAYHNMYNKVKKYGGFLLGEKTMQSIVTGYLNYITMCPVMLRQLNEESKTSEYVAVKEAMHAIANYLETQDHKADLVSPSLTGYFDEAYIVNNTIQILLDAKLIKAEKVSFDAAAVSIVNTYVAFVMETSLKTKLDGILKQIREMVGLKKDEINWGQVAVLAIGAVAVVGGIAALAGGKKEEAGTAYGGGGTFEDNVADFSAKHGGGLTDYL
jgi:hypothetical protein